MAREKSIALPTIGWRKLCGKVTRGPAVTPAKTNPSACGGRAAFDGFGERGCRSFPAAVDRSVSGGCRIHRCLQDTLSTDGRGEGERLATTLQRAPWQRLEPVGRGRSVAVGMIRVDGAVAYSGYTYHDHAELQSH